MTIGARELVEGVQKSVLIAEQNSIEVNAMAQENIAEENNIEVPCWYTFLGIPPARAAQLHSEAQEAATTEGCRNCSKRRKELQEVQVPKKSRWP